MPIRFARNAPNVEDSPEPQDGPGAGGSCRCPCPASRDVTEPFFFLGRGRGGVYVTSRAPPPPSPPSVACRAAGGPFPDSGVSGSGVCRRPYGCPPHLRSSGASSRFPDTRFVRQGRGPAQGSGIAGGVCCFNLDLIRGHRRTCAGIGRSRRLCGGGGGNGSRRAWNYEVKTANLPIS